MTLSPGNGDGEDLSSNLMGILAEAGDSSHIVGPAIVDDSDELESYLSTIPDASSRRMVRIIPSSNHPGRPVRPVLFNTIQRRPLGVTINQSLAAQKCDIIEKLVEPWVKDVVDLWVSALFPLQ